MDFEDLQRLTAQRKAEYDQQKAASAPTRDSTSSKGTPPDAITTEEAEVDCVRCGQTFATVVTTIMGKRLAGNVCPICDEQEHGERPRVRLGMEDQLSKIGVNVRRHGASTLEGFDESAGPAPVSAAREFVTDMAAAGSWAPVRSLMLCGNTGTGKTHIAVAIIREALNAGTPAHRIIFDRSSRLITEIQDTYGTGKTAQVLEARENAFLWVLDDLGAEKATPDSLRILHDLLDAREGHPNVITSNFVPSELGARFNDQDGWARIASRLGQRNFRIVRVGGSDHRFTRPAA